jgi:hypothetical protein
MQHPSFVKAALIISEAVPMVKAGNGVLRVKGREWSVKSRQ